MFYSEYVLAKKGALGKVCLYIVLNGTCTPFIGFLLISKGIERKQTFIANCILYNLLLIFLIFVFRSGSLHIGQKNSPKFR